MKTQQFQFTYNSTKYYTVIDDTNALSKIIGANVINFVTLKSNATYFALFKSISVDSIPDVPVINNPIVKEVGSDLVVTGTAIVDGKERMVRVNTNNIYVEQDAETPTVEIVLPAQAEVKTETSVQDVVVQTIEESSEVDTTNNTEIVKDGESDAIVSEDTKTDTPIIPFLKSHIEEVKDVVTYESGNKTESEESVEELLGEEPAQKASEGESSDNTDKESVVTETVNVEYNNQHTTMSNDGKESISEPTPCAPKPNFMNPPILDTKMEKKFTFGDRQSKPPMNLIIGCTSRGVFKVQGAMPEPNTSESFRNRTLRNVSITGRPVVNKVTPSYYRGAQADNSKQITVVAEPIRSQSSICNTDTYKELEAVWKNTSELEIPKPWDNVLTNAAETLSVFDDEKKANNPVDTEEKKKAKQEFRASLPESINAVIGDLPLSILNPIPEYTMYDIDTKALEKSGDLFCIDNRWHKCGKWFCIDVVNNKSRYFWNSRKNVSIEIPIQYLREWAAIISQVEKDGEH